MNSISTTDFVIAVSVADIHQEPDASSELVTQALMNVPVVAGEVVGDWTQVTLPDYRGWIKTDELDFPIVHGFCEGEGTCGVPLPYSVVATATEAPVYVDKQSTEKLCSIYLSTVLPYIDLAHPLRLRVALPGDAEGWIPREYVDIRSNNALFPLQPIQTVIDYAHAFLSGSIPYLWGGTTWQGLDCSALVQLCYRMGGNGIPRDADQQYDFLTHSVEQADMQAGDLIFFGREQITHVGIAINEHAYIHAEGQHFNRVIKHSLDPEQPDYNEHLSSIVWGIKRVR